MYDAIIEAANLLCPQPGRKFLIVLSDGEDTCSNSAIQDAINTAIQCNVSAFTIGLGLTPGSPHEQILQKIAGDTGGRYYHAPNSSDLQEIYSLISQQIRNQYKVTYTTHNPNVTGCPNPPNRTVQITVTHQSNSDTKSRTYTPPCPPTGIPIFPVAIQDTQIVDIPFWVDITVGNASNPVTDLFGVSFVLNWTPCNCIDVVTPHSGNVIPGSFLGTDLVFYQTVDEPACKVSVRISQKAGQSGVSGSGTVPRVQFVAKTCTPCPFDAQFFISDVAANDPNGNPIDVAPELEIVNIICGIPVWPGDTNNDGVVNQADILPLGLYWNFTGPVCQSPPSCSWVERYCPPWAPEQATYADANNI